MKKSLTLVLAILLFVVLGCSLSSLTKKDDAPTPVTDSKTGDSTDTKTTDTTEKPTTSSGTLTLDNFNKIKTGMSYEEVVKILGSEGTETSSSTVGKYELKSYKWEGEKFVRVYASFRNNELRTKSQSGLGSSSSRGGSADISKAKYDQIKTGMSYDEVKKIIGSDGEQRSSSSIGKSSYVSYVWKGPKFSRISASFRDDKLSSKSQSGLK